MDFEPLLLFSQVPGCDKLEIPGNDIFYEQIYFHFFIQSRPIRAEIRCLKRAFVIEVKQAHHGIEDIANKHHGTDAEGLHQVNIRVRCPTVLLRYGIKISKLSKRGQVDLVFTLPSRVNREKIAVARQIHQKILEKCRGAFWDAGYKNMPSKLLRSYLCRKIRKFGRLACCRQRICQIDVRAGAGIDRDRFSTTQEAFFIQAVLEENDPEALEPAGEFTEERGILSHVAPYLQPQRGTEKIQGCGRVALLQ